MLGALARDIIGSVYEGLPTKSVDFPLFQEASRFTDDGDDNRRRLFRIRRSRRR
jgi:hypothetical protein